MSEKKLSRKDRWKAGLSSGAIALLIRVIGGTLRVRVEDEAGVMADPPDESMIWIFWHNRIFVMPAVYRKFMKGRHGAVLTSPSGDGEFIAKVLEKFGVGSIRGSSNKRQVASLREMAAYLKSGKRDDVVITPDGPRGPVERLAPGVVKLAQLTGAPVFPIKVSYTRSWKLKTWDRFEIPWPFSRVGIRFQPLQRIARRVDENGFEILYSTKSIKPGHYTIQVLTITINHKV